MGSRSSVSFIGFRYNVVQFTVTDVSAEIKIAPKKKGDGFKPPGSKQHTKSYAKNDTRK